ncbi:MAG: ABC transporter ATP-binding protein, partial [Bifidobacterium crudilactis]|nr:ABC transporter ATP-binding protein [Bifidobacterium crudilactis]
KRGSSKAEFSLPLSLFNNGQFRIVVSLRVPRKNDPKHTDMIAFTSDENSCTFAISDSENDDYALISSRAMQITRLA